MVPVIFTFALLAIPAEVSQRIQNDQEGAVVEPLWLAPDHEELVEVALRQAAKRYAKVSVGINLV